MKVHAVIEAAIERKGWTVAKAASVSGVAAKWIYGLINPVKPKNPETVEFGKLKKVALAVEAFEVFGVRQNAVDRWTSVDSSNSVFAEAKIDMKTIERWISYSRCTQPYLLPEGMRRWATLNTFRRLGWEFEEIEQYLEKRDDSAEKRRRLHVGTHFTHVSILPESLFQKAEAAHRGWVDFAIDGLEGELSETSSLLLIPDNLRARVDEIIFRKTGMNRPCAMDVVDDRLVVKTPNCVGPKEYTSDVCAILKFFQALVEVKELVTKQVPETIGHLKKIAMGKKSVRR